MSSIMKPVITILIILVLNGCSANKEWQYLPESVEDEKQIYIVSHGWHTGIVISGENLGKELSFLNDFFGASKYFELGWGDRAFYQAKEVTVGLVIEAALLSSDSVIHVVSIPEKPNIYFPNSQTIAVKLSSKAYLLLKERLSESFFRDDNEQVVSTRQGIYGYSRFFQANGNFHLFNTCNHWTAQMLRSAGVPVDTFAPLTADRLMSLTKEAIARRKDVSSHSQ